MSAYDQGVLAYRNGDYQLARELWSQRYKEGSASAASNLGHLYYNGLGGKEDPDAAVELWLQAAESGVPEAYSFIGRSFREGKGSPQDLVQAYAWYRCAIAATKTGKVRDAELNAETMENAEAAIRELMPYLTDDQLAAAEALAKERVSTIYRLFGSP